MTREKKKAFSIRGEGKMTQHVGSIEKKNKIFKGGKKSPPFKGLLAARG